MESFAAAAHEWHALLRDVGEAFVAKHLDSAMQLAVALHCQQDAHAASDGVSQAERRDFLALSSTLRWLLETAVREHMTFLLPSASGESTPQAAELVRQQAAAQSLPEAFRLRFRQLLETHWATLTHAATFSLPRLQQLDWRVAGEAGGVVLRMQTTDGQTRTMQVPLRQFHELRHSAATVLQEMNEVEAHPMMRLAYMEQSSRAETAVTAGTSTVP